ncbi:phosphoribosylamine--glycine ligase [Gleimia europaea]|uniref:Phosphoribosylamine--glycine ligase n=1 Tax=Gleimia europaea ACS-120-V-Col10b TaxID=883069 RepID=A0A9W5RFK5_9ACTO|nr:phosphoribosylamine--glycine ligase [Gleimia europaea]EPD31526.1 phosphoribosylamine-glycine ligase [Gleimia europaea ACS-120-V-Col10b]
MNILLLGSGGREHALALGLARNNTLFIAPGNPGTKLVGTNIAVNPNDPVEVTKWATDNDIDLVVIGPEAPLVAGVADAVAAARIPVFGPSQAASMLEGSKAFAKDVMESAGVDTAASVACKTMSEVEAALARFEPPYVVKNDGLAAGKGVIVTRELDAARAHARACLEAPGGAILIEEFMDGPEVSLFCVTDGKTVVPLLPAQDFKRALDNDEGLNTGGMGAYCPLPWLPEGFADEVVAKVAQPVVDEMARRGTPFVGLLYCGLVVTRRGIRVIEFNARFGDPETQVVLSLLETDLADLLFAAATGTLADFAPLQWSEAAGVGVVVSAENYPATPVLGDRVEGIEEAETEPNTRVYIAGVSEGEACPVTSGGRVLMVSATGKTLAQARQRAYAGVAKISIRGSHHRTDIATRADQIRIPC